MNNFINQSLVFIGATLLFVPLFHYLGFGSVLGYLVGGILIGPNVMGLFQEADKILHFAELGVVLLLFIIGLEIQPKKLFAMRKQLFGLGGLQILICTLVFMGCCLALGLPPLASGIIGFALSLSSTAFALQTLAEKNQLNTAFGQSSFAILLMQDLVAIPALAIIPAFAMKEASPEGGALNTLLYFLLIVIFLLIASRFLLRPMFRAIANIRSRELFTALTLFIVLGVSAMMLSIGLSAALGTFMAGVLLADSEYRHELEANLDPFKNLLMGLFFVSVGMTVSLPTIMAEPLMILFYTLSYMGVKIGIIYTIGKVFGMNHENSKLMSLSIGQGGEFAFVIFGLAQSYDLAPAGILNVLTAVITLSMIFSPLLIIIHDKILEKFVKATLVTNYDEIKDESPEVIIAGFGRFGQIFGRILRSQNIPFVAIDHDADQVDALRKFGHKVYYGDASRQEILEQAGIAKIKYFILAIDDVEQSLKTAKFIRENYPSVKIFGRARNRAHVFELMELGVTHIKRETFDSSLSFVGELFVTMGVAPEKAEQMVQRFRTHDEIMLQEQFKVREDESQFVSLANLSQAQLAGVLSSDETQSFISFEPKDGK